MMAWLKSKTRAWTSGRSSFRTFKCWTSLSSKRWPIHFSGMCDAGAQVAALLASRERNIVKLERLLIKKLWIHTLISSVVAE